MIQLLDIKNFPHWGIDAVYEELFKPQFLILKSLSMKFKLPSTIKNFTIITEGHSKIRTGIRVVTSKRQRVRRELDNNGQAVSLRLFQFFPLQGYLRQETCVR